MNNQPPTAQSGPSAIECSVCGNKFTSLSDDDDMCALCEADEDAQACWERDRD